MFMSIICFDSDNETEVKQSTEFEVWTPVVPEQEKTVVKLSEAEDFVVEYVDGDAHVVGINCTFGGITVAGDGMHSSNRWIK